MLNDENIEEQFCSIFLTTSFISQKNLVDINMNGENDFYGKHQSQLSNGYFANNQVSSTNENSSINCGSSGSQLFSASHLVNLSTKTKKLKFLKSSLFSQIQRSTISTMVLSKTLLQKVVIFPTVVSIMMIHL